VRRFVCSLVGLLLVAVLVDYGTAAYAEYRVSREVRHELALNTDPDVRITGFPFLTQVAAGGFSQVNVRAVGVSMPGLGTVSVGATLRNVTVSPSQIFGGKLNHIGVGELDSRLRISDTQLGQLLGIPDLEVSAPVADSLLGTSAGGGDGAPRSGIVLTGTVKLGGVLSRRVSVNADLALQGGQVRIIATSLAPGTHSRETSPLALDGPFTSPVVSPGPETAIAMQKFSLTFDSTRLPFAVTPNTVHAENADIVIEGTGTNVVLRRSPHPSLVAGP